MEKNKKHTYLHYALLFLLFTGGGAVTGAAFSASGIENYISGSMAAVGNVILRGVWKNMIFLMVLDIAIAVIVGEASLFRMKKMSVLLERAEDEEADFLEYKIEKAGSVGIIGSQIAIVAGIILVAPWYSDFSRNPENKESVVLAGAVLLIAGCFYQGFWQVRYVKLIQKMEPTKKGDPTSMKFQKQWLESCDEAEKILIYQSSYRTYCLMSVLLPFLTVVTMLGHLFYETGLLAIFVVGFLWIAMVSAYCYFCTVSRKRKLNRD